MMKIKDLCFRKYNQSESGLDLIFEFYGFTLHTKTRQVNIDTTKNFLILQEIRA